MYIAFLTQYGMPDQARLYSSTVYIDLRCKKQYIQVYRMFAFNTSRAELCICTKVNPGT